MQEVWPEEGVASKKENPASAGNTGRKESTIMVKKELTVRNAAGIHCRPSSVIIAKAAEYPDHEFLLTSANGSSSLTSILDLLALGIQCGEKITLTVSGAKEEEACGVLAEALEREYDFK